MIILIDWQQPHMVQALRLSCSCSFCVLIIRIMNNLMPSSTVLFTCSCTQKMKRTKRRCKICSFIHNGCGRLTAEKKEVWKIFASEAHVKLPQVLQIVSAGCCLCNQIAYLSYRNFSCSLLPVNMHRCGNWKSHHLLLSHSCMWWCLIQALG